ncbi:BnaAnng21020D [Brassica napus]|uniref:BnaAnng21020D protein n=1 Tax=Brassica napus TaxID=3708 RepID=A0A078JGE4_BRANA|nr:BnaAnng21020D [Brassica napus]
MFLSTENPPRDPLSSSSSPANLLRLTTSPSHELGQSSFSIRDYAYSNRKNNIKNSWPFSTKSLQLCSSHGVTDPLPPFQKLSRLSNKFETTPSVSQLHQTIAEASKRVCNQSRIIEYGLFTSTSKSKVEIVVAAKSNNKSKKCGQGGGGGMVKTKGDSSGCLSMDSSVPPVSSKPNKPRVKSVDSAVKVKTLVDIYTTAKRCTLEDLDKRNGTQWASVLSCTNRVAADKCEVSKKRKGSPVGVGPVYIDAKGQKLRILTEFSEKKTTTTLREQQEDGSSEKKSSSQGSKENKKRGRRKKHGKCIKLTSHKANTAEKVLEYQREGSSKGPRRIYNQRMLAKRGLVSKKLNEKGHKLSALRYQPSDDDDEDDSWSGEDRLVLRGADTSATGSSPLNKQKLRSQVSGRSKTMLESKRAHSRSSRAQIEEKSLTGAYSNNTVHSKKSLASIQEDKHPPGKNVRDASPRATSMRNLSPPFVANGWRRLSPPVEELKKSRFDLSDEEEEEETGKWESEMTQERGLSDDDDYVSGDDNPSFSRYYDYDDDDDDDEESSDEEEEDDSNSRANVLDKSNDANEIIPSERAMYYSEDMIYGQTGCEEEDVRFGSEVRGKGSLFVEVDTIPIPGPPGSFLPSPRGMGFDGNSSVITSQFQSSMDQLDRNSSESPVSAVSNFASGRLNFQAEFPSSLDIPMSFCVPSHHGTIPEAEPMSVDKATTPLSFRNNDHESCCCQRKERVSLNHQASHLLQRRAASSSSIAMSLTKSPTRLDPNHPFEQSQCVINRANLNGAVVPPSPSNSVLRLMGKDLMVMNQGEADSNEEASRTSLKPTPQFHDPQPCAGTGLYFNTGFYLRNSFEPKYEQQTPKAQQQTQAHQASAFRNNFDHWR